MANLRPAGSTPQDDADPMGLYDDWARHYRLVDERTAPPDETAAALWHTEDGQAVVPADAPPAAPPEAQS